jgi:lipase chaperone LimK
MLTWLKDLWQRNKLGQALTPVERASLRLGKMLLYSAVVAGISTLIHVFSTNPQTPLGDVVNTVLVAVMLAVATTLEKFLSARNDGPPLTLAALVTQAAATAATSATPAQIALAAADAAASTPISSIPPQG